ncbi:hypothetical protein PUN28_000950 [Cardiocondyla obscurior]|uniref:Uncharacterized protein n=1 Tax=Cardiocondyla obscurior TaxID=286306 RepID=A0AAW2H2A2_9HYME
MLISLELEYFITKQIRGKNTDITTKSREKRERPASCRVFVAFEIETDPRVSSWEIQPAFRALKSRNDEDVSRHFRFFSVFYSVGTGVPSSLQAVFQNEENDGSAGSQRDEENQSETRSRGRFTELFILCTTEIYPCKASRKICDKDLSTNFLCQRSPSLFFSF